MTLFTILIDALTLVVCAIAVSGCGQELAVSAPTPNPTPVETPAVVAATPTASPTASPTPAPISVTYYSKGHTVTPNAGQPTKTYTATGYCTVISTKTFCWDDGIHTINYPGFPPVTGYYTYWGLSCNGTCTTDAALAPVLTDMTFINQIMTGVSINSVLTTGTPTTVSCSNNSGVYDCGSFSIDTNQSPF